jgi:hypothetical protein
MHYWIPNRLQENLFSVAFHDERGVPGKTLLRGNRVLRPPAKSEYVVIPHPVKILVIVNPLIIVGRSRVSRRETLKRACLT